MVDKLTNYDRDLDNLIFSWLTIWYRDVEHSACVYVDARTRRCVELSVCASFCVQTFECVTDCVYVFVNEHA